MTAFASSARVADDAGVRVPTVVTWAAAVALAVAVAATVALRPPDVAALAVARAFGAAIVRAGRVPLWLGPESFGAPHAWDGGLGWLGALASWFAGLCGPGFTAFATCATALLALALVAMRTLRRSTAAFALGATLLAAVCASDALRAGGGIENAAFAVALYALLERPGARSAAFATLLTALWCNASPVGLLAPVLAAIAAVGARLDGRPATERRWALLTCAGTALAMLATPAGLSFPLLAFEALRIDRALAGLVVYHPAEVSGIAYRVGFMLAVVTALCCGAGRLCASDALLWTCATLLALANGAYFAIFGVLVAPLLAAASADALRAGERSPGPAPRALRASRLAFAALALVIAAAAGLAGSFRSAPEADAAVLARTLSADGREHRLFCANVDWCGVAEAAGAPRVRGYMDGRVEAFPDEVRARQSEIAALKGDWRGRLEADRVDAVLVRRDRAFATLLALRGWRPAGESGPVALYLRQP
jgi:hypothetical protein